MKKLLLVSVLVVMTVGLSANADMMTYTVGFNDNYAGTFDISQVLSVPQFDSSLGTLQSVKIDFGVNADGWLGFENKGTTGGNKSIKTFVTPTTDPYNVTHGDLQLKLGASTLASVNWSIANTYTFYVTAFDGTVDYLGTSGWQAVYLAKADSGSVTHNSGLGSFIGSGTVDFDLIGSAWSVMTAPGGNVAFKEVTTGAGNVIITYEYIPEPATIAILSLGGLLLRRKK